MSKDDRSVTTLNSGPAAASTAQPSAPSSMRARNGLEAPSRSTDCKLPAAGRAGSMVASSRARISSSSGEAFSGVVGLLGVDARRRVRVPGRQGRHGLLLRVGGLGGYRRRWRRCGRRGHLAAGQGQAEGEEGKERHHQAVSRAAAARHGDERGPEGCQQERTGRMAERQRFAPCPGPSTRGR